MEVEEEQKPIFKETLYKISVLADKAIKNIGDNTSLIEIKNTYSETFILSKLQAILAIEKIAEIDTKTPDYSITFRGNEIYMELKSLNMLEGMLKHKNIMSDSLDAKISVEEQIKKGKKVAFGEQVIQPYYSKNNEYDPRSSRLVIESLIDKINQNIKEGQYLLGDTVLLVDLSGQLPLISKPSAAIQERYFDGIEKTEVSGELWNIAFGNLSDQIFKPVEFEGSDNSDGALSKEGMNRHPYIKGLIIHVDEDFYALAEITEDNVNVIECLRYLAKQCSFKLSLNN